MLKFLIILALITYLLRSWILKPIPGSKRDQDRQQQQSNQKNIEYTDYEELK